MLIVAGRIEIDPQKRAQAIEAATRMMAASREEEGCLEYTICAALDAPERFHILEKWRDQAALDAHFQAPHMAAFQAAIKGIVRGIEVHKFTAERVEGPIAG